MFNRMVHPRHWSRRAVWRRLALLAASFAVAASVVPATPAGAAVPSPPPVPYGVYQLQLRHMGMQTDLVVDVPDQSDEVGKQLAIWPGHNGDNQRFELRPYPHGGFYWIVSRQSYYRHHESGLLCLDISGGQAVHGTPIIQYPCRDTDNQLWKPVQRFDGQYVFKSKAGFVTLGYEHTYSGPAVAGAKLIASQNDESWRLIKSSLSFPTNRITMSSGNIKTMWTPACPAGWGFRMTDDPIYPIFYPKPEPYYESIGSEEFDGEIGRRGQTYMEVVDGKVKITLMLPIRNPREGHITVEAQFRLYCDPS